MRRRIAALMFALSYFCTNVCHAFAPTPIGVEIAQVMASRGAVTGLSRVFSALGPYGLLASILIPIAYGWVTQPDGKISIPGAVIPKDASLPAGKCWALRSFSRCFGSAAGVLSNYYTDSATTKFTVGGCVSGYSNCSTVSILANGNPYSYIDMIDGVAPSTDTLPATVKTLSAAIIDLPQVERSKPIPATQVATAVNQIWYDAAIQPGYSGPSYTPVTAADVQAVRVATGASATVGDLASQIGFPDPATVQNPVPATTTPATSPSPTTPQQPSFPTDYSREETQQAVLRAVSGEGVPDASAVDKDVDLAKIDAQNDVAHSRLDNITPESLGLPTSWFPSIPTAACVNPTVPNPLTGAQVAVEICQPVSVLSTFINGAICFFALVGSVRQVQSALKA